MVKKSPANAGDVRDSGSIPRWGKSHGGGHSNPLQYSPEEESHGQRSLVGYGPWDHRKCTHIWIIESLCCPSETHMTL